MPSHTHEAIAELLGDSPALVAELLESALGVRLPAFATAARVDARLTDLSISEFRSDGVLRFADADGAAVAVVVLEVQLRVDPDKYWTWPAYLTVNRARYHCLTDLLVFTIDEATAEWARTAIQLGTANMFHVYVIGPNQMSRIEDPAIATAKPELAVLSALAHSRRAEDATVIRAVLEGLSSATLEGTRFAYYRDVVEQSLTASVRRALEQLMPYPGYEPQSEVSKAIFRGFAEGKAVGIAEGKAESRRESLRLVLMARKISLTDEQQQRIEACADTAQLDEWILRAAVISDADQLFAPTAL